MNPRRIGVGKAPAERRIQRGELLLALVDQADAFADHFGLRIVAPAGDQPFDRVFKGPSATRLVMPFLPIYFS